MVGYKELSKRNKCDVIWRVGNIFLGEKFGSRVFVVFLNIRVYLDMFNLWYFWELISGGGFVSRILYVCVMLNFIDCILLNILNLIL